MRAYSFRQAIEAGLEPREYQDPVPEGECFARLDFKMWGKGPLLRCFFTNLEDDTKFSLPAFKYQQGQDTEQYSPQDMGVDFSEPGIDGTFYFLVIGRGPRGGIRWEKATPAGSNSGIIRGA